MPNKTRQGWVAPKPEAVDYEVNGTKPTGVFVQYIELSNPSLHYAGTGTDTGPGFELPDDPAFLRDIASAIIAVAHKIEEN